MCETCKELKHKADMSRSYRNAVYASKELLRHKLTCHPMQGTQFYHVTQKVKRHFDMETHKVKSYCLYTVELAKGTLLLNTPWSDKNVSHIVVSAKSKQDAKKAGKKILENYV